jgi:hypothetical protein
MSELTNMQPSAKIRALELALGELAEERLQLSNTPRHAERLNALLATAANLEAALHQEWQRVSAIRHLPFLTTARRTQAARSPTTLIPASCVTGR